MVSWFGGWWYTVDLHKRRNIHELSSATMLVSLKLASKDLVLDHQIDKTGTKPLICTGEVSHHTTLNHLEQQYASRT